MRRRWGAAVATLLLAACGEHFPLGERLLPQTYGPPYGSALRDNIPRHPHSPGDGEREAEVEGAESRHFKTYERCRAELTAELGRHHEAAGAVDISGREAVGHAQADGVVHEYRCVGPTLSTRSWRRGGATSGHGEGEDRH